MCNAAPNRNILYYRPNNIFLRVFYQRGFNLVGGPNLADIIIRRPFDDLSWRCAKHVDNEFRLAKRFYGRTEASKESVDRLRKNQEHVFSNGRR